MEREGCWMFIIIDDERLDPERPDSGGVEGVRMVVQLLAERLEEQFPASDITIRFQPGFGRCAVLRSQDGGAFENAGHHAADGIEELKDSILADLMGVARN
jgi:hypothetical protein